MTRKESCFVIAILLLLPLFSMAVVPFFDTSEPRYAEIARIMQQTGDWITPWFSLDVPFWGKPPLSFWAQALAIHVFGVSEFTLRLPSWLCLLATNAVLLTGLRLLYDTRTALLSIIVYSSCALVYVSSGAVLTDPFLTLGTTLSLVAFAVMVQTTATQYLHWWQLGFFLGLAIGLLAKGPLALVLSFAPIFVWYMRHYQSRSTITPKIWLRGFIWVAVLSVPWYILAELKTPGFLDYFIVGEHVKRFVDPGWSGDLYGTAHQQSYGTIWIYWLQASLPWGVIALAILLCSLYNSRLRLTLTKLVKHPLFYYWFSSALFTPLFFSFSANILWTYILPALAGFSVLFAIGVVELDKLLTIPKRLIVLLIALVPTVMVTLSVAVWVKPDLGKTERELLNYVAQQNEINTPVFYLYKPPFSAQFYSAGQVQTITTAELDQILQYDSPFYVAIPKNQVEAISLLLHRPLNSLYSNRRYVLIRVNS